MCIPKHLGSLLNAASGTSPPGDLNSGGWGRAQKSAFLLSFLSSNYRWAKDNCEKQRLRVSKPDKDHLSLVGGRVTGRKNCFDIEHFVVRVKNGDV